MYNDVTMPRTTSANKRELRNLAHKEIADETNNVLAVFERNREITELPEGLVDGNSQHRAEHRDGAEAPAAPAQCRPQIASGDGHQAWRAFTSASTVSRQACAIAGEYGSPLMPHRATVH